MNEKLKNIFSFAIVIAVLLLLGFAPADKQAKPLFVIYWGDLGARLVEAGVIDPEKFPNYYNERNLEITPENSRVALNTLWAFGLANKNPILAEGPMMDPRYGGAGNFASTGGWTLARGDAMNHYSMHSFVTLTEE